MKMTLTTTLLGAALSALMVPQAMAGGEFEAGYQQGLQDSEGRDFNFGYSEGVRFCEMRIGELLQRFKAGENPNPFETQKIFLGQQPNRNIPPERIQQTSADESYADGYAAGLLDGKLAKLEEQFKLNAYSGFSGSDCSDYAGRALESAKACRDTGSRCDENSRYPIPESIKSFEEGYEDAFRMTSQELAISLEQIGSSPGYASATDLCGIHIEDAIRRALEENDTSIDPNLGHTTLINKPDRDIPGTRLAQIDPSETYTDGVITGQMDALLSVYERAFKNSFASNLMSCPEDIKTRVDYAIQCRDNPSSCQGGGGGSGGASSTARQIPGVEQKKVPVTKFDK